MLDAQKGFTLIELIAVIVILGILAAVAIPKYLSLETEAYDAQAKAAAGAVSSSSAINYAKYLAAGGTSTGAIDVKSGTYLCASLFTDFPPTGVTVADASGAGTKATCTPAGAGGVDSTNCKVKHASGTAGGYVINVVCNN